MGRIPFTTLALPLSILALAACTSDNDKSDAGVTVADSGEPPDTGEPPDSGGFPDAEPAEVGPLPCLWDQGGEAVRGCDPGEVCNLAMEPHECVQGKGCNTDQECNSCSSISGPMEDCGHGYRVVAFCDDRHAPPGGQFAGTCTRSRAPCEPCGEDKDCGHVHPLLGGAPNKCLAYGDGNTYCGRPCGSCPDGFVCDATMSQCRRDQCDPIPVFCPTDTDMPRDCQNPGQICAGKECPDTGGAKCSTNDQPGGIGICIGFCSTNADCPAETPICNPRNGLCITGCTKDSCAAGLTCHEDGFCKMPCATNAECEMRYGVDTYCNTPGQPPPRYFKPYHDNNSCQTLGCEEKQDCVNPGIVCDKTQLPPTCVPGCYEEMDCPSGNACKSTGGNPPLPSYSREQCRALPDKADPLEIGVCCSPGCRDRNLQCMINEFCCAEPDSPYEDPATCLALTSTGGPQAQPGECFEMAAPDPWCHSCMGMPGECNSGYLPGYNLDPNINMGMPFQEQEFCAGIGGMPPKAVCGVTCNPNNVMDNQCPRGWSCRPISPGCDQNADCNGLECVGAVPDDPATMNINEHRFGRCKCGEGGLETAMCPTAYATGADSTGGVAIPEAVVNPRCVDIGNQGADLFCVGSYMCIPPGFRMDLYPAACMLE